MNIARFGILGTVLTFIIYSSLTFAAFKLFKFKDEKGEEWELDGL